MSHVRTARAQRLRRAASAALVVATAWAVFVVWLSGSMVNPPRPRVSGSDRPVLGLVLRERKGQGVVVDRAVSPAAEAGLRAGDRLVAIDEVPVQDLEAVAGRVAEAADGELVRIEARRADGGVLVDVRVEVRPVTPRDEGLAYEDVTVTNRHGQSLRGWFVPAPGRRGRAPAVAYGHGNAADRRHWLEVAWPVAREGIAQLFLDFSGRGESEGEVITLGAREADDLDAALDWLAARRDVDGGRLALAGRSMGAAAAVLCASRRPDVRGLVIDGAYAELDEVVDRLLSARYVPPPLVRPALFAVAGWRADFRPAELRPAEAIRRVRVPVLIVHGEDDELVPVEHALRLERAAAGPATVVRLPGVGHNGARGPDHASRVARFLASALAHGGRHAPSLSHGSDDRRRLRRPGPLAGLGFDAGAGAVRRGVDPVRRLPGDPGLHRDVDRHAAGG